MSEDFRNYLTQTYNDGAKTGNEADPKKVEHEFSNSLIIHAVKSQ